MTIQDHEEFNTLERVVSTDFNDLQNLASRQQSELIRGLVRSLNIATPPTVAVRSHVASGLMTTQSGGTTIIVSEGILGQQVSASPPLVPTPDSLDSSYRFGLNLASYDAGDPWDASTAYWLLQARAEQVTALTATRDIYNPTTQTFSPSASPIDKRYESQIVFGWKKGTATAIPTPDAGYAPIAAVYRPAGGGAITDADVIQLATRFDDLSSFQSTSGANRRTKFRWATNIGIQTGVADTVTFDLSGEVDGVKLFARSTGAVTINDTPFLDPSDSAVHATANYWWYVYLAKVDDQVPSGVYANVEHKGVLVASRVAPDDKGVNSGTIDVPDPIGGTVAAGDAIHVGLFLVSSGTQIYGCHCNDKGEARLFRTALVTVMNSGNSFENGTTINFATSGPGSTEGKPYGVNWVASLECSAADAASIANAFEFYWEDSATADEFAPRRRAPTKHVSSELWLDSAINVMSRTIRTAELPSGGGLSDLGTCVYRLYLDGFQF